MDYFQYLNQVDIISRGLEANAIAIPSPINMKYIIAIDNNRNFYNGILLLGGSSLKIKIYKNILIFLYKVRIMKYVFRRNLIYINYDCKLIEMLKNIYGKIESVNMYIANSKHSNSSITLQVISNDVYYIRWPLTDKTRYFASRELENINYLVERGYGNRIQIFDQVIKFDRHILYSYKGVEHYKTYISFDKKKRELLNELKLEVYEVVSENIYFKKLKKDIISIISFFDQQIAVIFKKCISEIGSLSIRKAFYHGDFSPTNILVSGQKAYLIDFEYSNNDFFVVFDLFHYFYNSKKIYKKNINIRFINKMIYEIEKTYNFEIIKEIYSKDIYNVVNNLYIFYLFVILRRYIIDEGMVITNNFIKQLLLNIISLGK